jgi:hypothetical protein
VCSISLEVQYKYYLSEHIHDTLNEKKNETGSTIYSEEQVILAKLYFFLSRNFVSNIQLKTHQKGATAATGKSKVIVCKIGKEADIARVERN